MKHPLLRILLICFLTSGAVTSVDAQVDLGSPAGRTPYDPYLGPVWTVLKSLSGKASPDQAAQLVRQGHAFRYNYNSAQPYLPQTPEQTAASKSGDCKAKSLWVASKLNDRGVRFVIGKAKAGQSISHAWLIWNGPDGWMILDATLYSSPLNPTRLSSNQFVPTYSFAPSGKYAHAMAAASPGAKNGDHL
jgi:hypothetical protein